MKLRGLTTAIIVLALCMGGWALAETDGTQSNTSLESEIKDLETEVAGLSSDEKLDQAVKKIEGMKTVLTSTSGLLDRVREDEKDVLKLNCINGKMAAIKGFLKVGEQSYGNLKDAVREKDVEKENHHFTLVAIGGQKVKDLGDEALVCAGETLRYSGDMKRTVTVDPEIAEVNPIAPRTDRYNDAYVSERLPELTPYQ